jgi:hypothetical protein
MSLKLNYEYLFEDENSKYNLYCGGKREILELTYDALTDINFIKTFGDLNNNYKKRLPLISETYSPLLNINNNNYELSYLTADKYNQIVKRNQNDKLNLENDIHIDDEKSKLQKEENKMDGIKDNQDVIEVKKNSDNKKKASTSYKELKISNVLSETFGNTNNLNNNNNNNYDINSINSDKNLIQYLSKENRELKEKNDINSKFINSLIYFTNKICQKYQEKSPNLDNNEKNINNLIKELNNRNDSVESTKNNIEKLNTLINNEKPDIRNDINLNNNKDYIIDNNLDENKMKINNLKEKNEKQEEKCIPKEEEIMKALNNIIYQ